jgi:hypothetical protein
MEDMIHETLESGGSITQAKEHNQELIVAPMSWKGCLSNAILFHTYLVVTVEGESPWRKVDSILTSRLLRSRKKSA